MSFNECSRNGCDNILCDRYSPNYGYICNECFNELIDMNLYPSESIIGHFMRSEKEKKSTFDYRWAYEEEFYRT